MHASITYNSSSWPGLKRSTTLLVSRSINKTSRSSRIKKTFGVTPGSPDIFYRRTSESRLNDSGITTVPRLRTQGCNSRHLYERSFPSIELNSCSKCSDAMYDTVSLWRDGAAFGHCKKHSWRRVVHFVSMRRLYDWTHSFTYSDNRADISAAIRPSLSCSFPTDREHCF